MVSITTSSTIYNFLNQQTLPPNPATDGLLFLLLDKPSSKREHVGILPTESPHNRLPNVPWAHEH